VKREVIFRPSALADLKDIFDYIEQQSPLNAARYVEKIEAFCMKLEYFSERGIRRDDLRPGIRILGFKNRISVAFVVSEEVVEIVRILYGGRDLQSALGVDDF
jgi:toxin ParE1/3/4